MTEKEFPIAAVLTAYHNRMMVSYDELRELIDFMTGHRVAVWDVPRARRMCARALERQFLWLRTHKLPIEFRTDQSAKFVRTVARQTGVGDTPLEVRPLRGGTFVPMTLMETL